MRVLVVDDEPAARAKLRRLLSAQADVSEVAEAADAPAALALLALRGFELAILDIEMPGGSGLQLAAQLPKGCCCAFSTAYGEHALQAFELGALDYLLKPCTAERLAATLDRVRAQLALPAPMPRLRAGDGETWWTRAMAVSASAWPTCSGWRLRTTTWPFTCRRSVFWKGAV